MNNIILIIMILAIPAIAQFMVTTNYSKYSKVSNSKKITGAEVAREILSKNGLDNVYVVETSGVLSDHYDSSRKVVRLSNSIYNGTSIAALAVAAHEVGHAVQDKEGYFFMRLRSAIFPLVNIATSLSYIIIFIGFILEATNFIYAGIALTAIGLLFQIITLPVEFDASSKAKEMLKGMSLSDKTDDVGVEKMLGAAALTYVAGVLSSALQIIRLLLAADRN